MTRPPITPGPWISYAEPQPNGCPIVGAGGLMICMLAHSVKEPGQAETALANAKAIAALPALLDTLEAMAIHTHAMTLKGYTVAERQTLARSMNEKAKAALTQAGYKF